MNTVETRPLLPSGILTGALDFVESSFGLEFPEYKLKDFLRRCEETSAECGFGDASEFLVDLAAGRLTAKDLDRLLAALIVDESFFMRHLDQLRMIVNRILPLIDRQSVDQIRIWSAGCARGEEPYSIAMLLDWDRPPLEHEVKIAGTDIVEENLKLAREGRYRTWSLRDLGEEIRGNYFTPAGKDFQLLEKVRSQVEFKQHNLAGSWPPPFGPEALPHLIVCRNVIIYMSRKKAAEIVESLLKSLAPGGFLVLGPSDAVWDLGAPLTPAFPDAVNVFRSPHCARRTHAPLPAAPKSPGPPAPAAPAPGPTAVSLREALEVSHQALINGDGHKAIDLLQPFLGELEADLALAGLYLAHGRNGDLDNHALHLLGRHPEHVSGYYYRALAEQRAGKLESALGWVRKALYLEPHFIVGHIQSAILLQALHRPAESERARRNAERLLMQMDPEAPVPLGDGRSAEDLFRLIAGEEL